jgi:hypothetical protein
MSLRLNGTTQYVDSPSFTQDTTKFTLAMRAHITSTDTVVLSKLAGGAMSLTVGGVSFRSMSLNVTGVNGGGTAGYSSVAGTEANTWHTVVFVVDQTEPGTGTSLADRVKCYINGVAATLSGSPSNWSSFVGALLATAGALRLGASPTPNLFTQMRVRDFTVAKGVTWSLANALAFHNGTNPLAITPAPTIYKQWKDQLNASTDIGTWTATGSPTLDATGDPTADDPPSGTTLYLRGTFNAEAGATLPSTPTVYQMWATPVWPGAAGAPATVTSTRVAVTVQPSGAFECLAPAGATAGSGWLICGGEWNGTGTISGDLAIDYALAAA